MARGALPAAFATITRIIPPAFRRSTTVSPAQQSERKVVLGDYYGALASAAQILSPGRARPWPVERAIYEAYERVVWVYRSVEVITGQASRLPFRLKQGGDVLDDHPLYWVLNKRANPMETGRQFRKRLLAQVMLSKRGAFVQVTRSRRGDVIRLDLLPPGRTRPVPGSMMGRDDQGNPVDSLIDHYEIVRADGTRSFIPADEVVWFREPHPIDPYSGTTPLEAAGMSVELDFFARLYNTQFLKNDARPGGILGINGDMDPKEMQILEDKFGHGPVEAGKLTVIAGEVSYVDSVVRPRDMQYGTMATNSRDEVLAAFGVPLPMLGNSAGRCLCKDELVRLADGRRVPAEDLVGKRFTLLTSTPEGHIPVEAWATLEQVCQVYRVTTESGRTLKVNGKHPLFAGKYQAAREAQRATHARARGPVVASPGWTPVSELAEPVSGGHWVIAVPTRIDPIAHNALTPDQAFVLGALTGDGCISQPRGPINLTTPPGEFVDAFTTAVEGIGDQVKRVATGDRVAAWSVSARPENRIGSGRGALGSCRTRVLLREVGLAGTTSHTKFIPDEVFGGSEKSVSAYLSGLFAADGYVGISQPKTGRPTRRASISLGTVSRRLAEDVLELLLRFGVNARIRTKSATSGFPALGDRVFTSHEVTIDRASDIAAFAQAISIPGKQAALDQAASTAHDALQPKVRGNARTWRKKGLNPDLGWERITSIEPLEIEQTIGIAVPDHHTYLSVFWEHNTFDNAGQDGYNFWTITMPPHLDMLVTGFDDLSDDELEGFFDVSEVPALAAAEAAKREEARTEFAAGQISIDEYRAATGKDPYGLPATRAVIVGNGTTMIPTSAADQKALGGALVPLSAPAGTAQGAPAAIPGGAQPAAITSSAHPEPGHRDTSPAAADTGESEQPAGSTGKPDSTAPSAPAAAPRPSRATPETKTAPVIPLPRRPPQAPPRRVITACQVKALPAGRPQSAQRQPASPPAPAADGEQADEEQDAAAQQQQQQQQQQHLEDALAAALAALTAMWTARTLARLSSPKIRKNTRHWRSGTALTADTRAGTLPLNPGQVIDPARWQAEAADTARPLIAAAAQVSAAGLAARLAPGLPAGDITAAAAAAAAPVLVMITAAAAALAGKAQAEIGQADSSGASMTEISEAVSAEMTRQSAAWSAGVACQAATATVSGAAAACADTISAADPLRIIMRTWRTKHDDKVRPTHEAAEGQQQPVGNLFHVGDAFLAYPGDPAGPPAETYNCRCHLSARFVPAALAAVSG